MSEYRADGVTYDASTQTYDAHYLAGNYYSWNTATAGTGASITSDGGKAPDSICPKGFKLPISRSNDNGSFYYLLNQYEFTDSAGSGVNSITRAPLFFVRSGFVYPSRLQWGSAGYAGYYWSSSANLSSQAYNLYFNSKFVNTSYDYSLYTRRDGFSVRCVAPSA